MGFLQHMPSEGPQGDLCRRGKRGGAEQASPSLPGRVGDLQIIPRRMSEPPERMSHHPLRPPAVEAFLSLLCPLSRPFSVPR